MTALDPGALLSAVAGVFSYGLSVAGINVLPALLILGGLIFVHELGHYLAARWAGVAVKAFSLGFGPRLCGWVSPAGTDWKLCAIPLGGYVKMAGERGDRDNASDTAPALELDGLALNEIPAWKRVIILLAGVAMNALAALVILFAYVSLAEIKQAPAEIAEVAANSPAAAAGLQPGDTVVAVNGKPIDAFQDLARTVHLGLDRSVTLMIARDGTRLQIVVAPVVRSAMIAGRDTKIGLIGVRPGEPETVHPGPGERVALAAETTVKQWNAITLGMWQMATGERSLTALAGVVGVGHVAGVIYEAQGWLALLPLASLISLSLVFTNLLPVPVLDGGQVVLVAIEKLRGAPLGPTIQKALVGVSLVLVVGLFGLTFTNDVIAIVRSMA